MIGVLRARAPCRLPPRLSGSVHSSRLETCRRAGPRGVVRPREHSAAAHRHRPGARKSSFPLIPAPPRLVRRRSCPAFRPRLEWQILSSPAYRRHQTSSCDEQSGNGWFSLQCTLPSILAELNLKPLCYVKSFRDSDPTIIRDTATSSYLYVKELTIYTGH